MPCKFSTLCKATFIESNGYCIGHQMYATGTPTIKVSTPVKKESSKIKEVKKELKKLYPVLLAQRPICEIKSPVCTKKATCLHHIEGRGINEVTDPNKMVTSCQPCNNWVEENHAEAEKMGFKNRRHHKK